MAQAQFAEASSLTLLESLQQVATLVPIPDIAELMGRLAAMER